MSAPAFPTGRGRSDTRAPTLSDGRRNPHPSAGTPYDTVTGRAIAAMVEAPAELPKDRAPWFIPSDHAGPDARSHDAQREHGRFWWLAADLDEGDPSLEALRAALGAVVGDAGWMIYATRSSRPGARRWRALVPLAEPVEGVDYADTATAYLELLAEAGGGELVLDHALTRPGQLVYLPNRGEHYAGEVHKAPRLRLVADHAIIRRRDGTRAARAAAEREAKARAERRRVERPSGWADDGASPVDAFNARHRVAELLERYGYTRCGGSTDWRSPMQTSRSFATRDLGDTWVSLSASDTAAGIGAASRGGAAYGDAFDLYAHFEHGGDFEAAVRAYGAELRAAQGAPYSTPRARATPSAPPPRGAPTVPWPDPDPRFLAPDTPEPPPLALGELLGPRAAAWVAATAEGAGAPADYVLAALLSAAGALVGNARWATIWEGWHEPPILWSMAVGNPSAGKSPAIAAVLAPVRRAERPLRDAARERLAAWEAEAAVAELTRRAWEERAKAELKKGRPAPPRPREADTGEKPHMPRLIVNDATVERLGVICAAQPKGALQMRDELAG